MNNYNLYFYAKEGGMYVNYLYLFTERPLRLNDSKERKDAIVYTRKQIEKIAIINDGIEIEVKLNIN